MRTTLAALAMLALSALTACARDDTAGAAVDKRPATLEGAKAGAGAEK